MKQKLQRATKKAAMSIAAALTFASSLVACSAHGQGATPMGSRASELKVGMTQDQAIEIMGSVEQSTTPPGFPPDCDSWGYEVDGVRKFIVVRYSYDIPDGSKTPRTIISIADKQDEACFLE